MEHKREYTAPILTVVEMKPERGFAATNPLELHNILMGSDVNSSNVETWDDGGGLFGGSSW